MARASMGEGINGTSLAVAIFLMCIASSSAPLATTTGALTPFSSYLIATEKWVGLVTTTSACGTSCIMRLVAA